MPLLQRSQKPIGRHPATQRNKRLASEADIEDDAPRAQRRPSGQGVAPVRRQTPAPIEMTEAKTRAFDERMFAALRAAVTVARRENIQSLANLRVRLAGMGFLEEHINDAVATWARYAQRTA